MRLIPILALTGALLVAAAPQSWAAPAPTCPTRSAIVDALKSNVTTSDLWLVLSFGSLVGLTGSLWGVPAGIAASLVGAGLSVVSGIRTLGQIDVAVQENLTVMAERLHESPDDLYDQLRYGEQVMAGSWLMRVAGASGGSILGLVAPLGGLPWLGMRGSVILGTAGGATVGGLWHRAALWPFTDELPTLCRAAGSTATRT